MHLIIAVWVPANVSVTILRCTPLFDGTGQIHLWILRGMLFNLWFMGDLTRRIRIKMLSCPVVPAQNIACVSCTPTAQRHAPAYGSV